MIILAHYKKTHDIIYTFGEACIYHVYFSVFWILSPAKIEKLYVVLLDIVCNKSNEQFINDAVNSIMYIFV